MASGFTTKTDEHLIRANIWSARLRESLTDDLFAMQFVRVLTEFPDGSTFNIPSLGDAETFDFAEGQAVKYNKLDTGNTTFAFDQYVGSALSISEKFKRDSFYTQEVLSSFVPKQHRAIMERVETRIFERANAGQTASDLNTINTAAHRWVAKGTNNTISFKDFSLARYALRKANVPMTNLVAVVDPSVSFAFENLTNVGNLLTPSAQWSSIINTGMSTGMRFRYNIMGFDVYESNYLPSGISETVNSVAVTNGVANLFFSATGGDIGPIIGGFRQQPTVYSEFNKDLQQTEYLTICEYGFKLYRPENMVVVLSDTTQVA